MTATQTPHAQRQDHGADTTPTKEMHVVAPGSAKPHLHDNALVVAQSDGQSYLIENGKRQLVSGPAALFAAGITPDGVETVYELPDDVLEKFPLAEQIHADLAAGAHNVDSGDVFLGAGHYMHTWGSVDGGSGQIAMQTRTRTVTWFGGYHGAVTLIFTDANNAPVYQTQSHRYGVDGTMIGKSDLTVAWWENMGADKAARATGVSIFQTWDPDSFQTILNKWVQAGKSIIDLITEVASVAKVVKGVL